jgi:hypothetical protein
MPHTSNTVPTRTVIVNSDKNFPDACVPNKNNLLQVRGNASSNRFLSRQNRQKNMMTCGNLDAVVARLKTSPRKSFLRLSGPIDVSVPPARNAARLSTLANFKMPHKASF